MGPLLIISRRLTLVIHFVKFDGKCRYKNAVVAMMNPMVVGIISAGNPVVS